MSVFILVCNLYIINFYPQYGSCTFVVSYLNLHITYSQLNVALLFWSSCICIWPGIVVRSADLQPAVLSSNPSELAAYNRVSSM